jgi:hypothetical protein
VSEEEWRPMVGFPSYEVSDFGNVRSVPRAAQDTRGWKRIMPGRPMRANIVGGGYLGMALRLGHECRRIYVHRAVAEAFIGPIPPKYTINHRNGDKKDNRVCNLEICTYAANSLHARRVLMRGVGVGHPSAVHSAETIREADRLLKNGVGICETARRTGVSKGTVSAIKKRKAWLSVTEPQLFGAFS